MAESAETTATFKRLHEGGLVSAKDLVDGGYHEAATAVMVSADPSPSSVGAAATCSDNANVTRRVAGGARTRSEDATTSRAAADAEAEEAIARDCDKNACVGGVTSGFARLADEIGKLFISDQQQQHRHQSGGKGGYDAEEDDDSDNGGGGVGAVVGGGGGGAAVVDPSSPIITERTILQNMCAPLFVGMKPAESPTQVRAQYGVGCADTECFVEHREPPTSMM